MDGGLDHTCALLEDGTVKCWGKNYNGALGLDDFRTRGDFPGEVSLGGGQTYRYGRTFDVGNTFRLFAAACCCCWQFGSGT